MAAGAAAVEMIALLFIVLSFVKVFLNNRYIALDEMTRPLSIDLPLTQRPGVRIGAEHFLEKRFASAALAESLPARPYLGE
jgi:hypothetical protein